MLHAAQSKENQDTDSDYGFKLEAFEQGTQSKETLPLDTAFDYGFKSEAFD